MSGKSRDIIDVNVLDIAKSEQVDIILDIDSAITRLRAAVDEYQENGHTEDIQIEDVIALLVAYDSVCSQTVKLADAVTHLRDTLIGRLPSISEDEP